ncbi:MAG: ATP-binding protein [Clostridiaceae bacterium]|nr:ATP-binding protein [Clostridiaceae bacterium]
MKKLQKQRHTIKQNGSIKVKEKHYNCSLCEDREVFVEGNRARPCRCKEAKDYQRILEKSGISTAFQQKTFSNFHTTQKPPIVKKAKEMAISYVEDFTKIKEERHNSIALVGQVGSGKSHITIAIANGLMQQHVGVLYMQYREAITALKQNMLDEAYYQREMSRYKRAPVLLIDDLYKGKITNSDLNIIFEIINYRYLNNYPILISSEYTVEKLLEFDEAIGSRIIEMCKGRIIEFQGQGLNHRLVM